MKKVLVVLALCVPFAAMLAVQPTLNLMEHVNSPFDGSTSMPEEIELANDEADPWEYGLIMDTGDRLGQQFTPPSYPFEVTQACYVPLTWPDWPDSWKAPCDIVFFAGGSEPGAELDRKENVAATEQGNWNWFDVSDLNITIGSGNFYCAVEYISDSVPGLTIDKGAPVHHTSWLYDVDGPTWYPWEEVDVGMPQNMGDFLDLVVRVKGNAAGIGEVELRPGGVVIMPSATIVASESSVNYTLPEAGNIDISLWDALGRPVKILYTGHADAGEHTLTWDASSLPSGAYFLKLKTANTVSTAKIVLID